MFKNLFKSNAVSVTDASAMAAAGDALIIDVRSDKEWKSGHARNVMHMPLGSLEGRLARLPKDRTILAICATGMRSSQAVGVLERAGFEARNVKGGMLAWQRAGLEIVVG